MGCQGRWASGLVCILMVAGAWRASAGTSGNGALSVEVDPMRAQGMCMHPEARLIFHSQGTRLWGTRPTWDESAPAESPTSVLTSIKYSVVALRQNDGQLSGESLIGSTLVGD